MLHNAHIYITQQWIDALGLYVKWSSICYIRPIYEYTTLKHEH